MKEHMKGTDLSTGNSLKGGLRNQGTHPQRFIPFPRHLIPPRG